MNNYDYPLGADTKDAPWNQEVVPEKEVEVTISVTLSKTVKIRVNDYVMSDFGKDEDGNYFEEVDFSDCDLKSAVKDQITLPQDAYEFIPEDTEEESVAKTDLEGWTVDDFEVILE